MLQAARPIAGLLDSELESVLDTTVKTLETRVKGVLYSHPTSSPHLQPLADWLVRVVTERRSIPGAPDASDADVLAALGATLSAARDHVANGPGRERYFELAGRVLGEALAAGPKIQLPDELSPSSGGGLIVPP